MSVHSRAFYFLRRVDFYTDLGHGMMYFCCGCREEEAESGTGH